MASYPSIEFPNKIVPQTFNKNAFETQALQSNNIITSSLNVLGASTVNTLQNASIVNTSTLSSNSITCTAAISSGSITNSGDLTSNYRLLIFCLLIMLQFRLKQVLKLNRHGKNQTFGVNGI